MTFTTVWNRTVFQLRYHFLMELCLLSVASTVYGPLPGVDDFDDAFGRKKRHDREN